jgi:hypothetical protein
MGWVIALLLVIAVVVLVKFNSVLSVILARSSIGLDLVAMIFTG